MLARWLLVIVVGNLLACGSSPPAPVEDRNSRVASSASTYYVKRGDTLYSIAFRYGLDYRKVAAANRISAPYTIYPGQRLALKETTPPPAPVSTAPVTSAPTTSPTRPASGVKVYPVPSLSKTPNVTKTSSSTVKKSTPYTGAAVGAWLWPTEGRVVRKYSPTVHKGINIDGKRGDPIRAVAPGKVVYAGTGIVGLGELLIVKHNDIYLSAYAHNDRLLVAEGDTVSAGQQIAEKGSSGTDVVKLHFEIRKEGKPIDPLRLLPRR